jgi:hypothetical protein
MSLISRYQRESSQSSEDEDDAKRRCVRGSSASSHDDDENSDAWLELEGTTDSEYRSCSDEYPEDSSCKGSHAGSGSEDDAPLVQLPLSQRYSRETDSPDLVLTDYGHHGSYSGHLLPLSSRYCAPLENRD